MAEKSKMMGDQQIDGKENMNLNEDFINIDIIFFMI